MTFYQRLKLRLSKDPRPEVEAQLFARLDREFARDFRLREGLREKPLLSFSDLFRWIPLAAAVALLVVFSSQISQINNETQVTAGIDLNDRRMITGMEEGVEFYDGMEEWMLTATEDDWSEIMETES